MMVFILCAIVRTVQELNLSRIVSCIKASVLKDLKSKRNPSKKEYFNFLISKESKCTSYQVVHGTLRLAWQLKVLHKVSIRPVLKPMHLVVPKQHWPQKGLIYPRICAMKYPDVPHISVCFAVRLAAFGLHEVEYIPNWSWTLQGTMCPYLCYLCPEYQSQLSSMTNCFRVTYHSKKCRERSFPLATR